MHVLKPVARFTMMAGFAAALAACGADDKSTNGNNASPGVTPPPAANIVCADVLLNDVESAKKLLQAAPFNTQIPALIQAILDPKKQSQADLLLPIQQLKASGTSQLCELSLFISHLTAADDMGTLSPLVMALNTVVVGLNKGMTPEQVTSGLVSLLALGTPVAPGNGATQGLITSVNTLTGNLLGGTILSPVNDLLGLLLNPTQGVLSPLTGAIDQLTDVESGALGQLTGLVDQLVNTQDEALNPLIALLNSILGGSESGQTSEEIAQGLLALANGQLFTKVVVAMIPFYGEALAAQAPTSAPQPKPATAQTPATGGSAIAAPTAPTIPVIGETLNQVPLLGPLLNGLVGGLLNGVLGGLTRA